MRILGIDYGTKRMGVAIGDMETRVAVPFAVLEIKNEKFKMQNVIEKIGRIVKKEGVELIVIGQGGRGPMEKKVQEFVKRLRSHVPVEIVDEHFTTAQIERIMKDYGKERRTIDKDSAAAALILQSYLDSYDV